ncbi:PIG-L family deacetylase, partial [bacterium]|nr:PIG-L family deacetylase [bacterium]
VLGIEHLGFLGWADGRLRERDALEAEELFAALIRREKPDVVITFHGSGISHHPDHRFLTLAVDGAFRGAGHAGWYGGGEVEELEPHRPARLYHYTVPSSLPRESWPRRIFLSPDDEITTRIDTTDFADLRWEAIQSHASHQYGPPFRVLYEGGIFASEAFVRIDRGADDGGIETDLLAGLP